MHGKALPVARGTWTERFDLPVPKDEQMEIEKRQKFLYTLPPAEASRRAKIDIAVLSGKISKLHSRAADLWHDEQGYTKPAELKLVRPAWRPAAISKRLPPPEVTKRTPRKVHVPFKLPLTKSRPKSARA
jgi:hypothetical protein